MLLRRERCRRGPATDPQWAIGEHVLTRIRGSTDAVCASIQIKVLSELANRHVSRDETCRSHVEFGVASTATRAFLCCDTTKVLQPPMLFSDWLDKFELICFNEVLVTCVLRFMHHGAPFFECKCINVLLGHRECGMGRMR